jgi:molybdate transport system ATP-binding protein
MYGSGERGVTALDSVDVVFPAGTFTAVMGPSGSGKSTLLHCAAGLDRATGGEVIIDGTAVGGLSERALTRLRRARVGFVFQAFNLVAALTAAQNVALPLRLAGRKPAPGEVTAMLGAVGLADRAGHRPSEMSGGQQQRVAMARALVTDPKLLLLDEPLAALDVSTKTDVRRLLRQVLRESSAANVLVTHDLLDAVALGDRMVVIENGGIVQTGTPAEVTARPRSRYVADLVGVNLLRGTARGTVLELDGGGQLICAEPATGPVLVVIAPAGVSVSRQRPEGQEQNTWPGQISAVDLMGDRVRVRMDGTPPITGEVPPAAVDELKLDHGGELWASVDPAAITVYPP